jgi:dTMP kinase
MGATPPPPPRGPDPSPEDAVGVVTESLRAIGQKGDRPGFHVRMFGSPEFFRLWLSQAFSSFGDWLGFLAIVILATTISTKAPGASVGLVMAARIVPGFFFGTAAGVLIDRMDRKQVMVVCDVLRAAVVATLPFVHSLLGLVFASLVLELCTLFFGPAKEASVPNLVPPENLTTANSLGLAAAYGTFPLASIAFALLATVSVWLSHIDALDVLKTNQEALAFYVNVLSFIVSALIISRLDIPKDHMRAHADDRRIDLGQVFKELKEGWSFVFLSPIVRAVNVGLATGLIGGAMVVPLGPLFINKVLNGGPKSFGLFVSALGIGVGVGIIGVSLLQRRLSKERIFCIAVLLAGVCLFVAASMATLLPAVIFVFGMGACAGATYVLGFTLLHENVDDELRGRVFSGLYTLVRLCVLIAFAVGPLLASLLDGISAGLFNRTIDVGRVSIAIPGERLTLWFAALIMVGAGLLATRSLRPLYTQESQREHPSAAASSDPKPGAAESAT